MPAWCSEPQLSLGLSSSTPREANLPAAPPFDRCSAPLAVDYPTNVHTLLEPVPTTPTASRHTVIAREAIPADSLMAFDLEDGTLYFYKAQVPDPPKVTFADDLSQLFKEWYVSDLLRKHARDALRVQWGLWKYVVAEREHYPSEDLFWAHYSDEDGHRLNFKTICELLQDGRKESDEQDAAAALWFFGNDLAHPAAHGYFHYKKSGKQYLCTKVQAIAGKWHQLLREHPEVAQQWERVRDQFLPAEPDSRT
ncbi:hypothetical protein LXA43DRAFT_1103957 [Ganoderma leucocontextum]|nr:hypothetical protein LXA43DRAFT_1103956 [Ganoderma leucocontextum]KAI1782484.1 hypothetical protein LXA43DRAFT_1103957 [Ganoderma leucocontextum]